MQRKSIVLLPALLALVLVACAPTSTPDGTPASTPAGAPTTSIQSPPGQQTGPVREGESAPNAETVPAPQPVMPELQLPADSAAVQAAVADLSTRLGIGADEITVVRAEPVVWSDGSLGCPQPDMMYTQALVDGVFIQLKAGDKLYDYHGGGSQDIFLCESAAPVAPGETPPGAVAQPAG